MSLYKYLEKSFSLYPLACKPRCSLCCTTKLFVTSIEAEYLLKGLKETSLNIPEDLSYPRPKYTHNQTMLLYYTGEEPQFEEEGLSYTPCPFLTEEGLCRIYERRPLACRILLSLHTCSPDKPATYTQELYLMGLIALQIMENIDIGGLYGNLFDLLPFLKAYREGKVEEVPSYLLSTVEFEELPLLPEEKELRAWVGNLYRLPLKENIIFKDLLNQIKKEFKEKASLTFLQEIYTS